MKNTFFIICFTLILFIQTGFSCGLAVKTIGVFDKKEYIFIGKVIGYTQPIKSKKLNKPAYGIIVKVKESVHLPKKPKTYFEIFPIELWADCSISGTALALLIKDFPVDSEVRIIAKKAKILPKKSSKNNLRLELRPGELSSIALNYDEKDRKITDSKLSFDYKSFTKEDESDAIYLLPNFEIRKDLLRLKRAKTQREKNIILNRLFYAPVGHDLNFSELFEKHTSSADQSNQYFESHLKMTDPEFYKEQYLVYKETLAELLKLGYKKKKAENALGKAIEKSTDFSKQSLLRLSLGILKSK